MPESEAMAEYAISHGIDPQKLLTETKSTSTEENLLFSKKLINKKKPKFEPDL